MKKIIIILSAILLVNMQVAIVYASDENLTGREEIYQEYKDDPQFIAMLEEYGQDYADKFIDNVMQVRAEEMLRGGGGNICYQYVTNIKQTQNYNCGSTTVLQTLYGLGKQSQVAGSSNADKISTLDAEYDVKNQGSLYVYQVVDALNKYSGRTYIYEAGRNMTQAAFEDKIAASLTNGRPVILHARTEYIGYYGGHQSGHYISLDYVNRTSDKVRLVDCNNNNAYYGIHNDVDIKDAYDSINAQDGRYLIR